MPVNADCWCYHDRSMDPGSSLRFARDDEIFYDVRSPFLLLRIGTAFTALPGGQTALQLA